MDGFFITAINHAFKLNAGGNNNKELKFTRTNWKLRKFVEFHSIFESKQQTNIRLISPLPESSRKWNPPKYKMVSHKKCINRFGILFQLREKSVSVKWALRNRRNQIKSKRNLKLFSYRRECKAWTFAQNLNRQITFT